MNKPAPQENGLLNIMFNILLPILILNNLSQKLGPLAALALALAFPLSYGLYDGINKKRANFFSILGLSNTLLTGGLAVLGLGGIWFAVKEAAFPTLVGCFVLTSAYSSKPFIKTLFINHQFLNLDLLMTRLQQNNNEHEFIRLMKTSTLWLSLSFFFSAALNFLLAERIFLPLQAGVDSDSQSVALNHQIAEMTKYSMVVILIPSVAFLLIIFWRVLKSLSRMSGLSTEEIFPMK